MPRKTKAPKDAMPETVRDFKPLFYRKLKAHTSSANTKRLVQALIALNPQYPLKTKKNPQI